MSNFSKLIRFGYSPTMLFPKSFDDPLTHFAALQMCCRFPHYEAFETYLPEDKAMREACIREMKAAEIIMNYNTPGVLQMDGPLNPCSDDPSVRANALAFAKMHADFAGECEARIFVATGCVDKGEERRPELMKRYKEYFMELAAYCKQYHMNILIEPIERHRFKKLILGPTSEVADFVMEAQKDGADNAHLMMDIAHLPLMEEELEDALRASIPAGLLHIHMGEAVLEPNNRFFGHTHPPVAVQGGMFHYDVLVDQFTKLFQYGIIPKTPGEERASISLEVRPYTGASEKTSIQFMYEVMKSACDEAAGKLGIY